MRLLDHISAFLDIRMSHLGSGALFIQQYLIFKRCKYMMKSIHKICVELMCYK